MYTIILIHVIYIYTHLYIVEPEDEDDPLEERERERAAPQHPVSWSERDSVSLLRLPLLRSVDSKLPGNSIQKTRQGCATRLWNPRKHLIHIYPLHCTLNFLSDIFRVGVG